MVSAAEISEATKQLASGTFEKESKREKPSEYESGATERRLKQEAEAEESRRTKEQQRIDAENRKLSRRAEFNLSREEAKENRKRREELKQLDEQTRIREIREEAQKKEAEQTKLREREKRDAADRERLRKTRSTEEGIRVRREIEDRNRKEQMEELKKQQKLKYPTGKKPITPETIKESIKGKAYGIGSLADKALTGTFVGVVSQMEKPPTQKEAGRAYGSEMKKLSTATRNKLIGKNEFASVIGASGTIRQTYVTDGHGRSGKRATLEWRRAHRNYQSPERAMQASVNEDWWKQFSGVSTQPVRRRRGSKGKSGLDSFVDSIW